MAHFSSTPVILSYCFVTVTVLLFRGRYVALLQLVGRTASLSVSGCNMLAPIDVQAKLGRIFILLWQHAERAPSRDAFVSRYRRFQSWFDMSSLSEDGGEQFVKQEETNHLVGTMQEILRPFLLRRTKVGAFCRFVVLVPLRELAR